MTLEVALFDAQFVTVQCRLRTTPHSLHLKDKIRKRLLEVFLGGESGEISK